MAIEIKNTKDLKREPKIKALIYGAPGSGKTTFAGTFPNPLILNVERGLDSVIQQDLAYVDVTSWDDIKELFKEKVFDKFDTIVVDSLSELQDIRMNELSKENGGTMGRNQWGVLALEIPNLIKAFEKLDKHIVFTGHEAEEIVEDIMITRVSLKGSAKREVLKPFNMIMNMFIEADEDGKLVHKVRSKTDLRVHTKSRFNKVPEVMDNPTFDLLYEYVKASATGKRNPKLDEIVK